MSFGLGTRTFYAKLNNRVYQFDDKRCRDKFVENGAEYISAYDAYKEYKSKDFIQLPYYLLKDKMRGVKK